MKKLVKAALRVAEKYPVFPTNDKMPCWSNEELGVAKGQGGYKIATQDHDEVVRLFSHPRAKEIAVPMGSQSGLMCIDVDTYKNPDLLEWVDKNAKYLDTLCHKTRSGGLHFIFLHPGDTIRFPATLREGVDVKAVGNGYICWPDGIGGYERIGSRTKGRPFPMELLKEAMIAKGGSGNVTMGGYNDATDDDLIERIQAATDLYPSLRTLSYRLPSRRMNNGGRHTRDEMVLILQNLMDTSVASDPAHARHNDWTDRYEKIEHLIDTSVEKEAVGISLTDAEIEKMTEGETFIKMEITNTRPIGPQRETTISDIEKLVAAMDTNESGTPTTSDFVSKSVADLNEMTIPPIEWLVPGMIGRGGTLSLAGMSNVGKTRFITGLVTALAVGDTARMGLPQCEEAVATLVVANEEHVDDIWRRCKAAARQHGDRDSLPITVRGKGTGMLRLVAMNEAGFLEVDANSVAMLIAEIRRAEAQFLILDPYVTLSDGGGDENSATSAAMITKALLLIIEATGCAIMHAHHTPKGGKAEDRDWPRGDSAAWRGSGAIYSALDCGFTLANWYPSNGEQRKAWRKAYLTEKLGRWVVLDTGKIREGEPLDPVIYELVGQEMAEDEGRDIGVLRLATVAEAENALLDAAGDKMLASELGAAIITEMGYGRFTSMAAVSKRMKGHDLMIDLTQAKYKKQMFEMYEETVACENGYITMVDGGTAKQSWAIITSPKEKGNA